MSVGYRDWYHPLTREEIERFTTLFETHALVLPPGESVNLLNISGRGVLKGVTLHFRNVYEDKIHVSLTVDGNNLFGGSLTDIMDSIGYVVGEGLKPVVIGKYDGTNKVYVVSIVTEIEFKSQLLLKVTNNDTSTNLILTGVSHAVKYVVS